MWVIELEPEVTTWINELTDADFARTLPHVERLAQRGHALRMPASRSLGGGLMELRFDLTKTARRITYYFAPNQKIVLLTEFRKQRSNERLQIKRARQAMHTCITTHQTHGEDHHDTTNN